MEKHLRKCMKHSPQMHRHIERIAERYMIDANGKPAVLAVTLSCEQIDQILDETVARATGHELDHHARPQLFLQDDGSPHLSCSYCGSVLTCDVEDAYCEIVLHLFSSKKQGPR